MSNLYVRPSGDLSAEIEEPLCERDGVRLVRIWSTGQTSEIYDQDEHEWVSVLKGEATLRFPDEDGAVLTLAAGDHVFLPAHRRHQVTYTSDPCLWLCAYWRV